MLVKRWGCSRFGRLVVWWFGNLVIGDLETKEITALVESAALSLVEWALQRAAAERLNVVSLKL
jgi:hypothetical protein